MKYLKFFLMKLKNITKGILTLIAPFLIYMFIFFMILLFEGFSLEEFGFEGFNLNPNDYCNLTDVEYTAILHDDENGKANVEITEYITFDVHAS